MGRVIYNGPPEPPIGKRWCPACLMDAKQRQWELHQDEINAGHAKGGDELTVIPWPRGLTQELSFGEYFAVCGDFPNVGMIDGLCWSHVAGINPSPPPGAELDTTTTIPPGLLRRQEGKG